jgi:hypothetical protein
MMKLDLGAGAVSPEGFVPLGNINGTPIFPLASVADNSCDVIRASHVLEHFAKADVPKVIAEWVRCLRPGGELKIAVPDFRRIAEGYLSGQQQPTDGYVMGGQVDGADFHKALFDELHLKKLMAAAGLMLIRPWTSELPNDCAALPISLNLVGVKPHMAEIAVSAVMSVPRLGFMDNFFCAFEALPKLNIKIRRYTGAYWSQCIERVIEQAIAEDAPDVVLTLDYDSVYTARDVGTLMQLMCCYPQADAIAAVQAGRGLGRSLVSVEGSADLQGEIQVPRETFAGDLFKAKTAHFGLTLLRSSCFQNLPRPWFRDEPDDDGRWGDARRDADIEFWNKWADAGHSLYLANRVPIGHLDLSVLWPGEDLKPIHQPIKDFRDNGKPKECWT